MLSIERLAIGTDARAAYDHSLLHFVHDIRTARLVVDQVLSLLCMTRKICTAFARFSLTEIPQSWHSTNSLRCLFNQLGMIFQIAVSSRDDDLQFGVSGLSALRLDAPLDGAEPPYIAPGL
jgi:hypothetical protein